MSPVLREFPKTAKLPVLTFPKPSQVRRTRAAVKVFPDGREVCQDTRAGRAEYARRTELMYERDITICCICHEPIEWWEYPTFEHPQGRGMGGAHRDDRVEVSGVAHYKCNAEKGSRRVIEQALDMAACLDCDSIACVCEGGAR